MNHEETIKRIQELKSDIEYHNTTIQKNYGQFTRFIRKLKTNKNWDLSKDNFNDQSEDTKTFIGNLLNNK